jgi:hypothetical protein
MVLVISRFATCTGSEHRFHRHHHQQQHATSTHEGTYPLEVEKHMNEPCLDKAAQLLSILGLLIEALLFGMFTSCMVVDQFDVVFSSLTHIDRLKQSNNNITAAESQNTRSTLPGIAEVFGVGSRGADTRFRPDWLSPFARICFPASIRDEIMGFCRPCVRSFDSHSQQLHPNKSSSVFPSHDESRGKGPRNIAEMV